MNRELKFRCWNTKEKSWVSLTSLECIENNELVNIFDPVGEDNIISQFTGVKDKNDNDVYEGDIVKFKQSNYYDTENYSKGIVKFGTYDDAEQYYHYVHLGWFIEVLEEGEYRDEVTLSDYPLEIIGNIFENDKDISGDNGVA
jgi:uncharacterized phage protein (TIGR01671 family)